MIRLRTLLPFLIFQRPSLLFSVVIVDVVEAKLFLWPTADDDGDSPIENKEQEKANANKNGSIHDRLRLFHKRADGSGARVGLYRRALSPAKYLELMFRYLRSSVEEMARYFYPADRSSQPSSSSAYELLRRTQYSDMMSEPKDAWEGFLSAFAALRTGYVGGVRSLVDGAYELGHGAISACLALFAGEARNDDSPLSYAFLSELFYGLSRGASHAADGLSLFAAGAVVGTRNLMVGIYRTPMAMRASQLGKTYYPQGKTQNDFQQDAGGQRQGVAVWDYYCLNLEDREIQLEEERLKEQNLGFQAQNKQTKKDSTRNIRRRRIVSVKDSKYYDMLGVATDADLKEIRSAYRREALKRHPDKQAEQSSPPMNDTALSKVPHIDGFLDLTEAYRILSNDASREAYDQHGLCFREERMPPEEGSHEDYVDLIDELFGASAVREYVGKILIAPIVNEMFGFAENHNSSENEEIQKLQQRRRIVDIAKHLNEKINPYVRGGMKMEDFTHSCQKESNFILRQGGESFLRVIGSTLLLEADQRTGLLIPFVRKTFTDSTQMIKSSIANARVYVPFYFQAALEGLFWGAFEDKDNDDSGDCPDRHRPNKDPVDQDAVLDLLWHYIVNDTVATLREACEKLFADQGTRDASLAFLQTPSLMKYQRAKKAKAIRILAREMLSASAEVSERIHGE